MVPAPRRRSAGHSCLLRAARLATAGRHRIFCVCSRSTAAAGNGSKAGPAGSGVWSAVAAIVTPSLIALADRPCPAKRPFKRGVVGLVQQCWSRLVEVG